MPLSFNEPPIIDQLSQAIKKMRNFLIYGDLFNEGEYYETLYREISKLTIKAKTEGYYNYEHKNPHKTLYDFLKNDNIPALIEKYYSVPTWSRKLIKQSRTEKTMRGGKKIIEWIFNQISKIKPDIKI